ncbi:bifunctional adenosylcobinamide kinase/adenosylcobinamide-phosphate guanylyltransferase [Yoonia sp.]|uniref:bifunctional adenosylcobinamide kinase/adenosylcobinamide-phosphate guanylyltransferase n=1 Tax=Yoonia sp. TaxID=2212373 RepID=UPI0025E688D1|nr:bifunctional adenosylcobinamide kinase/adenosylcobinamide-phosphate guanylyltransferase [Yoonia sp.]
MTLPKLTLVLGGAASGKSAFAENLILRASDCPTYIATAQVYDDEMAQKVARHRDMRGTSWHTVEEPVEVAAAMRTAPSGQPILIDCATLWLTNLILGDFDVAAYSKILLEAAASTKNPVVIVSNEVGQGIVPDNALARQFRNAQGILNQQIALQAELVVAVMAGLPLSLKGPLP